MVCPVLQGFVDALDLRMGRDSGPYAVKLLLMAAYVVISHFVRSPAAREQEQA
jgi:hypothetical protein